MTNFQGLTYFRPDGNVDSWGDPSKISRELLLKLDQFRHHMQTPVYITSGYRANNLNSEHSRGNAVDCVLPGFRGTGLDLFLEASRFDFKGIGLYRDWTWKGNQIFGLHLDVRREPVRAKWFSYKDSNGVQQYTPMTEKFLKLHGVI